MTETNVTPDSEPTSLVSLPSATASLLDVFTKPGEIDLYSIEIETSSANFEELGATDKVELNPALATFNTHHFLAHKSNPKGREILDMLNRGMQEMRETGEWYDIVATGLEEYNKLKQK